MARSQHLEFCAADLKDAAFHMRGAMHWLRLAIGDASADSDRVQLEKLRDRISDALEVVLDAQQESTA